MVINRYVKASPVRTSSETWSVIKTMLTGSNADAKSEFEKVSGVIAAIISDEKLKEAPLILSGGSPRVRVFCYYDEDAIEQDAAESAIPEYNFSSIDWKVMVPIWSGDEWVTDELKSRSKYFVTYDAKDGYTGENVAKTAANSLEVDLKGLANL